MKENVIAKTLQIIGIIEVICGVIAGLVILANNDNFNWVGIAIIIISFITCIIFVGFAEVINLLQKNTNNQEEFLSLLKDNTEKENSAPKSVLQDIESNLPNM